MINFQNTVAESWHENWHEETLVEGITHFLCSFKTTNRRIGGINNGHKGLIVVLYIISKIEPCSFFHANKMKGKGLKSRIFSLQKRKSKQNLTYAATQKLSCMLWQRMTQCWSMVGCGEQSCSVIDHKEQPWLVIAQL